MKKRKFFPIEAIGRWLSRGEGLPLEDNSKGYVLNVEPKTKNEKQLIGGPHAVLLIGAVQKKRVPANVPLFVFGRETDSVYLTEKEEDERAIIVDNSAILPEDVVKNAVNYLIFEWGKPARGEKPKILVVSEFPLLAAMGLGSLNWFDFYFRPNHKQWKSEDDINQLVSAYVSAYGLSRGSGEWVHLGAEQIMQRPPMVKMIPTIKKYRKYLMSELIQRAGLKKIFES